MNEKKDELNLPFGVLPPYVVWPVRMEKVPVALVDHLSGTQR